MKIPTVKELKDYADSIGWKAFNAERCWDYWEERGWYIRPGIRMQSYQAMIRNWRRMDQVRGADTGPTVAQQKEATRRQREEQDETYIKEYAENILAIRTWIGHPQPMITDPAGEERALVKKIADNHGRPLLNRVYQRVAIMKVGG